MSKMLHLRLEQSRARTRAVDLLTHYMQQVYVKVGFSWRRDNDMEMAQLVDAIVEATVESTETEAP